MYLDLVHTHGVGQMHGLRHVVVAVLVIHSYHVHQSIVEQPVTAHSTALLAGCHCAHQVDRLLTVL